MLVCRNIISAKLIRHSSDPILLELFCQTCVSAKLISYSSHLIPCICSEVLDVFQGHDYTRRTLTPVTQQRGSTKLALHLESDADSAHWEALVRRNEAMRSLAYHTTITSQPGMVTDPQGTQEVEGDLEAELVRQIC